MITVVSAVAGVVAAFAPTAPTAWRPASIGWTVLLVAAVTWLSSTARWWVLAFGAIAATVTQHQVPWVVVAAAGFVVALGLGVVNYRLPAMRSVGAALVLNARVAWFHGAPSLVTGAVAAAFAASGLSRRNGRIQRTVRRVAIGLAVGVGVCLAGSVVAGVQARGALRASTQQLRAALRAVRSGDVQVASDLLRSSSAQLATARDALQRPWASLGLAVPVASQQLDVLRRLTDVGADAARVVSTAIAQVNVDSLRVVDGRIDLDSIALLGPPLQRVHQAAVELDEAFTRSRGAWLVAPLADRLSSFADDLASIVRQTQVGSDVVALAPSLLGRDGPRTYFVMFTTPAEARGTGGYMATWAEVRADRGTVTVTRTGSTIDLITADTRPVLQMPDEFHQRYGPYGAGTAGQRSALDYWSNVTMPADFPTVGQVVAQLYPASGGTTLDGVLSIDVPTIARFMRITGPITVTGVDHPLTSDNIVDYITKDQYVTFATDSQRDAVLADLTAQLVHHLFGDTLPGPRVLAEAIGPAVAERRLVMWSAHPDEETVLRAVGADGGLVDPGTVADGFQVVVNNAGANKLDAYLHRSVTYRATVNRAASFVDGTLEVSLTNTVANPASLPAYAAGNPYGLPVGTNRMLLSIYTVLPVIGAEDDSGAATVSSAQEHGWWVTTLAIDLAPGATRTVRVHVAGSFGGDAPYTLVGVPQPALLADSLRLELRGPDDRILVDRAGRFGSVARVTLDR